jgi:hypothetical protein
VLACALVLALAFETACALAAVLAFETACALGLVHLLAVLLQPKELLYGLGVQNPWAYP